jgi:hypothetical protein
MSRSVHTRPARIPAPARVWAPRQPRGQTDRTGLHRRVRTLKRRGTVATPALVWDLEGDVPLPPIRVSRPRTDLTHPATRADVAAVLRLCGAEGTYGLRAVELRSPLAASGSLCLGRYEPPGLIILFAQPASPWSMPGALPVREHDRLCRAGAQVEILGGGTHTRVTWSAGRLRDFILYDVLLHEVGHHVVQQYTGKRAARVMRTRDHEAVAERFAARCRAQLALVEGDA